MFLFVAMFLPFFLGLASKFHRVLIGCSMDAEWMLNGCSMDAQTDITAMLLLSCSTLLAPTRTDVTPFCSNTQFSASCAIVRP